MVTRSHDEIPGWLWKSAREAEHRLLMSDFDGTLAPFTACAADAEADPRSLELLREITDSRRTAGAIVSGRPVHQLMARLAPLHAWLVGEHGWEIRFPHGEFIRYPLEQKLQAALASAAEEAHGRGLG